MGMRIDAGGIICAAMVALGACDDQFDFDTQPGDAEAADLGSINDDAGDAWLESDATRPAGEIACGNATCVLPLRACCVRGNDLSCIEVAAVDCGGVLIHCDSSNDCRAGAICCATVIDGALSSVRCDEPVECTAPGQSELCDPADPNACSTCAPAAAPFPAGYHACR
jgi:hypothetical protein